MHGLPAVHYETLASRCRADGCPLVPCTLLELIRFVGGLQHQSSTMAAQDGCHLTQGACSVVLDTLTVALR